MLSKVVVLRSQRLQRPKQAPKWSPMGSEHRHKIVSKTCPTNITYYDFCEQKQIDLSEFHEEKKDQFVWISWRKKDQHGRILRTRVFTRVFMGGLNPPVKTLANMCIRKIRPWKTRKNTHIYVGFRGRTLRTHIYGGFHGRIESAHENPRKYAHS